MSAPALVPLLKDLCIKIVARNFQQSPTFGQLPEKYVHQVTDQLSLDLPLELAAPLITDDAYWKKRACARWKNCVVTSHGTSWKQLYMEQHLQEALEQFDTTTGDLAELRRLMVFSRRFVQCLRVAQLPSHLDLQLLFDAMEHTPTALSLCYSLKAVGMDYDRSLFGMSLADCRCLARALAHTETLVVLDLSNNCLDDDKMRMLASGLADNISVTHLNLSHNRVSDRGVRALAKLLDRHSVITLLDLSDNQMHADSGRSLARALGHNKALLSLNCRLNRLGDEGCGALCEALCHAPATGVAAVPGSSGSGASGSSSSSSTAGNANNSSSSTAGNANNSSSSSAAKTVAPLERLNLSSNGAGVGLLPSLCSMLRYNRTLLELDVSSNTLGEHVGQELLAAVAGNAGLMGLDVRGCGIGPDAESSVDEEMLARLEKRERRKWVGPPGGTSKGGSTAAGSG